MRNPFYHRQGIADPRYFYGRGALVRSLLEMIDSGQSCAVVGERRIGKSSLLAYLADAQVQRAHRLEVEHTLVAGLDFLALHTCSASELWLEILEALELETDDERALDILSRARRSPDLGFATFRRVLRRLKRSGFRVVLLCDEFELAVQNPQFDGRFFGALRSLAGGEGVVYVTASRLSLLELGQHHDEEVRQKVLGSPFFNIFAEFTIGPFEDFEVAEMIATSLDTTPIRFSDDDIGFLDSLAGRHPYCLQLGAYHLFEELQRAGLGRSESRHARVRGDEIAARLRKCREQVREHVLRESAKLFRNQWKHSNPAELRALTTFAARETSNPEGEVPTPGPLDGRMLARLETRGLIKELRSARRKNRHGYRDTTQSSRRFRLFSELLGEWIRQHVPLPFEGESSRGSTETPGRVPVPSDRQAGPFLQPTQEEGTIPERYRVLEELGHGGAGRVFKAWDERLERLVAIKVLDRQILDSPERFEPLLDEARICAGLHHPQIVIIYDIDPDRGFLVQEFLAGGSLRDLLDILPVLPLADVLSLAENLGAALDAAHRAGVVHRDLKPENILLATRPPLRNSQAGRPILATVKLADFGTALRFGDLGRLAERRAVAGTLAYMAPEQLAGKEIGPTADLFALGVVIHEAHHGALPPGIGDGHLGRARSRRPPGPGGRLSPLLDRCLAPHPKDRFPTAAAFLAQVRDMRKVLD